MSEFVRNRSRETTPLPRPEGADYQSLTGEDRVLEAIRQQPNELREVLLSAWEVYKGMLQNNQGGVLQPAERSFFDEILAEANTVPPDFEALQRGAGFPSNKGKDTQSIKGAETMAEQPVDFTVSPNNVHIIEPKDL